MQKARSGGYDGRGVSIVEGPDDPGILTCPSFLEGKVDIEKELAVVVALAPDGSTAVYPCVEMVFDPRANLCESVLAPARIGVGQRDRAEALAVACVAALCEASVASGSPRSGSAGVFGVEMFLTRSGGLLVNEVAPRPHNSGHFSIEACASSQFDQYIRLLLGYPLGSSELLAPAMMVNLFGEPGESGRPEYPRPRGGLGHTGRLNPPLWQARAPSLPQDGTPDRAGRYRRRGESSSRVREKTHQDRDEE